MRGVIREYRSGKYKGNVTEHGQALLNNLIDTTNGTFSTDKGKKMAQERIEFIKVFVEQLGGEIID